MLKDFILLHFLLKAAQNNYKLLMQYLLEHLNRDILRNGVA